jgi:type IV pilus assembly protein PilV
MHAQISQKKQHGMMLLEGLIAILIFSLGILAIVGVHAAAVRHTTDAKYRAEASFWANQSIGEIWADPASLVDGEVTDEIDTLPSGSRTVSIDGKEVTVTVTWQMPGEATGHQHSVVARINEARN